MPNKAGVAMKCAFCDGTRLGKSDAELQVTLREASGPQRQFFGVHVDCMNEAMADGYNIEVDALKDADESRGLHLVVEPIAEDGDGDR